MSTVLAPQGAPRQGGPRGGIQPQLIGKINLLGVGDSGTIGVGDANVPPQEGGYRGRFFNSLWSDTDINWSLGFGLVGAIQGATFFNDNCWAFLGSTIEQYNTGGTHDVGPQLTTTGATATFFSPNCCILMLGTNNAAVDSAATMATKMASLLSYVTTKQPSGFRILLPTIIPTVDNTRNIVITAYNSLLYAPGGVYDTALAGGLNGLKCDLNGGVAWVRSTGVGGDFSDNQHLNAQGYDKEAAFLLPYYRQLCGYSPYRSQS